MLLKELENEVNPQVYIFKFFKMFVFLKELDISWSYKQYEI